MVAKSGNGWQLAPSLVDLIDEVDARWPNRKKSLDGSIGDQAHAARSSEHNPDRDSDPMPRGLVSALDITKDSAAQMEELRRDLIADPRTWYVIHDGKIWSRTYGFRERAYNGASPHTGHMHVSLMQTSAGARRGSWDIVKAQTPKPTPKPDPKPVTPVVHLANMIAAAKKDAKAGWPGKANAEAKVVEEALGERGFLADQYVDGLFGTKSVEAYAAFQRSLGFRGDDADGIPGLESLRRLGVRSGFTVKE